MRRSSLLLLAAALCGLGQAQNAAQNAAVEEKPASFAGEVRNAVTGQAIERAHVVLRVYQNNGWDRYGALTDGEGRFTITNIPPGNYTLGLDRTGYVPPASLATASYQLSADQKKDNVKLKLVPVGAILGRVVDGEGAPMEGVTVQVLQAGRSQQSATTDDRGQYRIGGLAPGKYRVKAALQLLPLPPEIRTDGTAEVHYASTFYPGVAEERAARRVEVGPATDVTGIDMKMVAMPILRLSGRVSGLPEGAKNGSVQLRQGQNMVTGAQLKPDGTFEVWRPDPGKYTLQAMYSGAGEMVSSAGLEVEVGQSDVENLELRMTPPEDIGGQIAYDDEGARRPPPNPQQDSMQNGQQNGQARRVGAASPGQSAQTQVTTTQMTQSASGTRTVQQTQASQPARVMLRDAERGYVSKQETVGDDDHFTFSKVQPGRYVVQVQGYPGYVKSARLGKTEGAGGELDLSNGANGGALTVVLASTYGSLQGTVIDDKGPAAGMRVLVKDTQNRGFERQVRSGKDGTYKAGRLPPGKYRMVVMDENDNSAVLSSDPAMEDFDEAFEVGPNETVTRDVKLHPVTGKLE